MRVEALERISSDGYVLEKGDILTVRDEVGAVWCAAGWACDTSGALATGERIVMDARLTINPSTHGHKVPNLEG